MTAYITVAHDVRMYTTFMLDRELTEDEADALDAGGAEARATMRALWDELELDSEDVDDAPLIDTLEDEDADVIDWVEM